jgi:hypothetical protein
MGWVVGLMSAGLAAANLLVDYQVCGGWVGGWGVRWGVRAAVLDVWMGGAALPAVCLEPTGPAGSRAATRAARQGEPSVP